MADEPDDIIPTDKPQEREVARDEGLEVDGHKRAEVEEQPDAVA